MPKQSRKRTRSPKQSGRRTRIRPPDAVQRLMQLLEEELIQFSCRVLEIEEEKARAFLIEANKVVDKLNKFEILNDVPYSYVVALEKGLQPLALTINEDLMDATRSPEVLLDSRRIVTKIPDIMCQLENMKFSLEDFVHKLDGEISSHPVATLLEQRQLASELLASNKEFRKVIGFFNGVVKEAEFLYDRAGSLLLELKDSSHDMVNGIKTAAERAGDSIEEFVTMAGNQFWWQKEDFMDDKNIPYLLEGIDYLLENPEPELHSDFDSEPEPESDSKPEFDFYSDSKSEPDFYSIFIHMKRNKINHVSIC